MPPYSRCESKPSKKQPADIVKSTRFYRNTRGLHPIHILTAVITSHPNTRNCIIGMSFAIVDVTFYINIRVKDKRKTCPILYSS
jgi:hypothetical protein